MDKLDTITMNVPLFIRALEHAREDLKTDVELHVFVDRVLKASKTKDVLTIDDYDSMVPVPVQAAQRLAAAAANARAIEKEIKRRFNKDVCLHRGNGYYYFADPDDQDEMYVTRWPESSVYVHRLSHLGDTDAWVREFERLMKEYEKWK